MHGTQPELGTISGDAVTYWSGPALATSGTGTFVAQSGLVLSAPQTAAQWFGPIEENSATWNPSVVVAFPPGVIAGDYQGTVTFSVA
ncbi:hypothetical protein [Plantactinospora soyae]|uniref:Uncharacterized protein n=1 Tax=Plantactinospora soyae TaxID=1544732 RepID=A0A927RAK8_9ACTN|nr:hypothetical protein [Plantactinospora soyae]MBE1490831.1 hypothetical protein [Plantactinospora soyae]